jgi:hypothetical protein
MILDGNQISVFKTSERTIHKVLLINYTISKTDKKCTFHFSSTFVDNIYLHQQILSELLKTYPDMHVGLFMWSLHSCCVKCGIPTVMKIQIICHIVMCWLVNSNTYFSCTPKCNYLPTDKVSHLHYCCSSLTKIGTYCYTVNELQNIKLHKNMFSGYLQPLVLMYQKHNQHKIRWFH